MANLYIKCLCSIILEPGKGKGLKEQGVFDVASTGNTSAQAKLFMAKGVIISEAFLDVQVSSIIHKPGF